MLNILSFTIMVGGEVLTSAQPHTHCLWRCTVTATPSFNWSLTF
jgi:hypothetical protein